MILVERRAREGAPFSMSEGVQMLDVGNGHYIYFEQAGQGIDALVLHGGPGSGCQQGHYDLFDLCLLYTSPSPRDKRQSRMPSSA